MKLSKRANITKKAMEPDQFDPSEVSKNLNDVIDKLSEIVIENLEPISTKRHDKKMNFIIDKIYQAITDLNSAAGILNEFAPNAIIPTTGLNGPDVYDDVEERLL